MLEGEVSAGKVWAAELGQGWVLRLAPIASQNAEYSGWDLIVDRATGAGYPDALLLATPPYGSLNEREIGTTFGLRAQDAIGWNPRSFRFLTDPVQFAEAQKIYRKLLGSGSGASPENAGSGGSRVKQDSTSYLLAMQEHASTGELRILDAHIVPGTADPAVYAQNWAIAASRTPHEMEPASEGQSSARGRLAWMRFSVTLWLPGKWVLPPGNAAARSECPAATSQGK